MGIFNNLVSKVLYRIKPVYLIRKSTLFDEKWYSSNYGVDSKKAAKDYLLYGYKKGCEPSLNFSGYDYQLANPDTRIMNPLIHYEVWGREENRILGIDNDNRNKAISFTKVNSYIKVFNRKKREIKKCAIFASYCKDEIIPNYVVYYLKELSKVVDAIIFVTDNNLKDQDEINKIIDYIDYAQFGNHNTFDFGSYKIGLEYLINNNLLKYIDELYMTNDSCYGPIDGFENVINKMSEKDCDFWGLLDSHDRERYHLLSFFYCFKNKVINDIRFINFFNRVKDNMSWEYTVNNLETTLTEYLSEYYKSESYIKDFCDNSLKVIAGNMNPTLWPTELLKIGFPLVKIKCLDGRFGYDMHSNTEDVLKIIQIKNKELYEIIIKDLKRRHENSQEINCFDLIDISKIISFDIFDTLLVRPFATPTDLYIYLGKKYNDEDFARNRVLAEKRARRNSEEDEVSIDDIYVQMPIYLKKFKQYELEEEMKLCYANPVIENLYNYAVVKNKKIIATSDMYLKEDYLLDMLHSKGYHNIEKVFVSSKCNHTKWSGKLYKDVLNEYRIRSNELLHIGDNETSDISVAKEMGIKTHKVNRIFEKFLNLPSMYKYNVCWKEKFNIELSIHLSLLAKRYSKPSNSKYFEEFGYALGGPLALGYLFFISEKLRLNSIDQALFVARDGYSLQILFNKYFNSNIIPTDYVYLTRAVVLSSLLNHNDEPSYIKSILLLAKKENGNINIYEDMKSNLEEYKKHKNFIYNWAKNNKKKLEKYLNNISKSYKSIAIIDMTTLNFTSLIGAKEILKNRIAIGIFTGIYGDRSSMAFESFCKRELNSNDVKAINISELLISSPEPSIESIDENGMPIYTNIDHNRKEIYDQLFNGIDEYINDYISLFGLNKNGSMSFETWINLCNYFLDNQNPIDKKELEKIMFNEEPVENQKQVRITL